MVDPLMGKPIDQSSQVESQGPNKENVLSQDSLKAIARPEDQLPQEGSEGVSTASPRTVTNQETLAAAAVAQAAFNAGILPKKRPSQEDLIVDNMVKGVSEDLKPEKYPWYGSSAELRQKYELKESDSKAAIKGVLLHSLSENKDISPGRSLLLGDMIRHPTQIFRDVERLHNLTIGGKKIALEQKGADAVIELGTKVMEYILSKNAAFEGLSFKQFNKLANELVYATVQNFSSPLAERQSRDPNFSVDETGMPLWRMKDKKDYENLPSWKKLLHGYEEPQSVYFQLDKSGSTMKVTRAFNLTYTHINEPNNHPEKKLNYSVTFDYNLNSKDVTVTYVYELDGQKVSWRHPETPPPYLA